MPPMNAPAAASPASATGVFTEWRSVRTGVGVY